MKTQGFVLLELIIALALALFLSTAAMNTFIQSKKTYYLTQRLERIQTNARIAFHNLSHDIRMAGLIGCVRLSDFLPLHTRLTPETRLVVWHDGFTSAAFDLPYLPKARPHGDIILIQLLNPDTIPIKFAEKNHIALLGRSPFQFKDKVLISNCQYAEAFEWGYANLRHRYQTGSEIGFLDKIIYYVGDTGRQVAGKPIYALYRRNLNKSSHNSTELVEGIEKMYVSLGVKDAKNGSLIYRTANQVKRWSDVCSVAIDLVFDERPLRREWTHIVALRERD